MSDDLVVWLRAQLDEDERIAREASESHRGGPNWVYETTVDHNYTADHVVHVGDRVVGARFGTDDDEDPFYANELEHIARHDPARVLREVAAKRWIVNDCVEMLRMCHVDADGNLRRPGEHMMGDFARWTLANTASVYADRPGYREEWKP